MKTKNKIWIVPMLALVPVLALAAFLFAGVLTGGGGVPTVEGQAFSGITITPSGDVCEANATSPANHDDDVDGGPCITRADSLDVSIYVNGAAAAIRRVYVTGGTDLPEVKTSSSSIGNQHNLYFVSPTRPGGAGNPSLGKIGVDSHILSFDSAVADRVTGLFPKRAQTITVTRDMANHRGDVYLFVYNDSGNLTQGSDHLNNDIFSHHFCTNGPNNSRQTTVAIVTGPDDCLGDDVYFNSRATSLDGDAQFGIRVKFLGKPAVGVDGPDRNTVIEDFRQCVLGRTNTSGRFAPATTHADGVMQTCDDQGGFQTADHDETDDDDLPEIRSRLVAHVAAGAGAGAAGAAASYVIDGSSAELALGAGQDSATIYAIIHDDALNVRSSQAGNYLVGEEVTFHLTTQPAGIESGDRTEEARGINSSTNSDTLVAIPLATRNILNAVNATRHDNLNFDDAVAIRTIGNLPDSPFRIAVRVTAGGVEIGTINIVRRGDPSAIEAGIYAFDGCAAPSPRAPATPDATHDVLNLKGDDCAMDLRYGSGQMFVVDTAVKDTLDTSLSEETVSVKIDDAVLQKMTHGGATLTNPNVPNLTLPTFDVYRVKEDAAYGMSAITFSNANAEVADVVLNFHIAGPPATFSIGGPDTIAPGEDAEFIVTAKDVSNGVPHITEDNSMVPANVVFSPANAATVEGITGGMIMLDDEGMATITVDGFGVRAGVDGRIRVGAGAMRVEHTFSFGDAGQMPGGDVTAPTGVTARAFGNSVVVSWTPDSAQNADIIVAVVFSEDFNDVVALDSFNPASSTGDPGGASFAGLAAGTYNVVVAATRGSEDFVWDGVREVEIP